MKVKKKGPAPDTARELIAVAEWDVAMDALLSWQSTERSINDAVLQHERAAVKLRAEVEVARRGVEDVLKKAGLPSPYDGDTAAFEWSLKDRTVYRVRKQKPKA